MMNMVARIICFGRIEVGDWYYTQLFLAPLCHTGSGAFQMPTCPSSSSSASAASTLRGGRANLRNASVTFSLFWHEASLGSH